MRLEAFELEPDDEFCYGTFRGIVDEVEELDGATLVRFTMLDGRTGRPDGRWDLRVPHDRTVVLL